MANTSLYIPAVTQLDGGLDLANPKQAVSPGSLKNCLNVEVAERVGYKSVDGIERHDGRIGPSAGQRLELVSLVSLPWGGGLTPPADIQPGDNLLLDGEGWAVVVSLEEPSDPVLQNAVYTNVYIYGKQEIVISGVGIAMNPVFPTIERTLESFGAAPLYLTQRDESALDTALFLNAIYDDVHDRVTGLPNNRRPHGLHWFRDRLYAVADMLAYAFTSGSEEVFANDVIEDSTGRQATVRSVTLTGGTWGGGNAAGIIHVDATDDGESLTAGNIDIVRPDGTETNAFTLGAQATASQASLWRTTEEEFVLAGTQTPDGSENYGWNPVDMGYELPFEDGNYPLANLPSVNRRSETGDTSNTPLVISTDPDEIDAAPQAGTTGTLGNIPPFAKVFGPITLSGTVPDDIDEVDTNYLEIDYTNVPTGSQGPFRQGSPVLNLTQFPIATSIPSDATIEGVEFQFMVFNDIDAADNVANVTALLAVKPHGLSQEAESRSTTVPANAVSAATQTTISVGGPEELWGQERITPAQLQDVNFGFDFQTVFEGVWNQDGNTTFNRRLYINTIKIKVYYSVSSPKVYFWDGTDDVSALIANIHVSDGSFPNGTASGILHVYNLIPESGAARRHINPDDEIRTSPGGEGNLIANVAGAASYATLPSLQDIVDEQSRYQMITANFYANEAWDAIYGVSGAGRAFVYDQQYFRRIYAGQLADTLDKPRHIEFHAYHLALGYKSGSVLVSVVGDPENFAGLDGAFEISTGDRVTGLLSLPGTMLGIGCQQSIWGLAGATVQNFQLQTLRPKEGVIEYTMVDMGVPVYCSNTGISVFETTPAYADFVNQKISYNIYPFLYPRLYKQASRGVNQRSVGVICAIPVRSKGQYLVFFQDGYVLCMSLRGGQQAPQYTFRRYHVMAEDQDVEGLQGYLTPIAHTAQNDSLGRERIFVSHYNADIQQSNSNTNLLYAFELDKGWSFAGNWFPWNYITNWNYVPQANPKSTDRKVSRKVTLYGLSYGISHMSYATSATYQDPSNFLYDISLPPKIPATNPQIPLQKDLTAYQSKTASIADRGEYFSIAVRNQSPEFDNNIQRILPPVVSQVLLQEYDPAREGA